MNLIEFIKDKIINFETFINDQVNNSDIPKTITNKIIKDINIYKDDLPSFIAVFKTINKVKKIDNQIKLFFSIYDIDINDYPKFNKDRLIDYINMFTDLCSKL